MARPKKEIRKSESVHMRFTPEEIKVLRDLADEYRVDRTELIRRAIFYVDAKRPILLLKPVKSVAQPSVTA